MNITKYTPIMCGALLVALTGCATYVERQPPRTVYLTPPAQPPPPAVYVPPPESPAVSVESPVVAIQVESDFYEPLSAHGRWVVVGSYGRCWVPARVDAGWRPYCDGNWRRTDAGWYWASDEPWGWATYHYGRWDFSVELGWYWLPRTEWAPAWVSWRQGDGYVGWAPLPPAARIGSGGFVEVREASFAPRAYVFVSEQRLLERVRPTTVIINNTTVVNRTVNITKIQVVNKTVINEGPRPEVIERRSGRKIEAVPVRELRRKEETEVVARQPHIPPGIAKRNQPPLRTEPAPATSVPGRDPRQVERSAPTRNGPAAKTGEGRGVGAAVSSPTPARSETQAPIRNEGKTEVERAIPPRETSPRSAASRPSPSAQPNEVRAPEERRSSGAPARPVLEKPLGHERQRELEAGKGKLDAGHPAAGAKSAQPPTGKQVEKRKTSSKPAAGDRGRKDTKKKGDEKKDKEQETPPPQPAPAPQPPVKP
jgi:hypothetical protein